MRRWESGRKRREREIMRLLREVVLLDDERRIYLRALEEIKIGGGASWSARHARAGIEAGARFTRLPITEGGK